MESELSQQFCLRWHNHQSSVLGGLPALLDSGRLTDVTLCAGGRSLRAHRIVLSTCSPYFMDIFKDLPVSQQPVVVILGGGWSELCCLVTFMYAGEVTLPRSLLPSLLRLAKALQITGLTDLNGNIPDVPLHAEFDDTFNSKFESIYENMKLSRQNSDSVNSTENLSPFQQTCESNPFIGNEPLKYRETSSSDIMQDNAYHEMELLKQLSKQSLSCEKNSSLRDEIVSLETNTKSHHSLNTQGKKIPKNNKSNRYLNPVLNELESKNRKIDKIVENLKCNQMKTQENISLQSSSVNQVTDNQTNAINVKSDLAEMTCLQKSALPDASVGASSKVANIFTSNILMEIETENIIRDSVDNVSSVIKNELDSSSEVIPDNKNIQLSTGTQPTNTYSSTNTKLFATCYVCHKRLSNQYNLRVHLETHQNARHACIACSHVSRSRDALRKHVSYRHPQLNISHNVGRPCKANQNTQTVTSQTTSSTSIGNTSTLSSFSTVTSGEPNINLLSRGNSNVPFVNQDLASCLDTNKTTDTKNK